MPRAGFVVSFRFVTTFAPLTLAPHGWECNTLSSQCARLFVAGTAVVALAGREGTPAASATGAPTTNLVVKVKTRFG